MDEYPTFGSDTESTLDPEPSSHPAFAVTSIIVFFVKPDIYCSKNLQLTGNIFKIIIFILQKSVLKSVGCFENIKNRTCFDKNKQISGKATLPLFTGPRFIT